MYAFRVWGLGFGAYRRIMENHMSGDQNPYPVSLTVRNLLRVAYETQGLAYGARFS